MSVVFVKPKPILDLISKKLSDWLWNKSICITWGISLFIYINDNSDQEDLN